jgi:hypothetical protein
MLENGSDVGCRQERPVTHPQHERALLPYRDHLRAPGRNHEKGIAALQPGDDFSHRRGEVSPECLFNEVGNDLRVGLGTELVPAVLEFPLQGCVVLDDPVVDHGDGTLAVEVRVGILVIRDPVRGPPGVADPHRSLHPGKVRTSE